MKRSVFVPSPFAPVDCQPSDGGWTLVFVRGLRHPPEKVWTALTSRGQLSEWAPFLPDHDLDRVGEATLTIVDGEHREDLPAFVRRCERPTLLEYTWGDDVLRWELAPSNSGTRLTLRHDLQHRDWVPKVAAGWHLCLDVAERLLAAEPIGPIRGQEALAFGWQELHDGYASRLGIDAGPD
jgi:uncharacterized protein YndB with AHSA1/START domain